MSLHAGVHVMPNGLQNANELKELSAPSGRWEVDAEDGVCVKALKLDLSLIHI